MRLDPGTWCHHKNFFLSSWLCLLWCWLPLQAPCWASPQPLAVPESSCMVTTGCSGGSRPHSHRLVLLRKREEILFCQKVPWNVFLCFIGSDWVLCPSLSQSLGCRGGIWRKHWLDWDKIRLPRTGKQWFPKGGFRHWPQKVMEWMLNNKQETVSWFIHFGLSSSPAQQSLWD